MPGDGFNVTGLRIFPKSVLFALAAVERNRSCEGTGEALRVSSNNHRFLAGVGW